MPRFRRDLEVKKGIPQEVRRACRRRVEQRWRWGFMREAMGRVGEERERDIYIYMYVCIGREDKE